MFNSRVGLRFRLSPARQVEIGKQVTAMDFNHNARDLDDAHSRIEEVRRDVSMLESEVQTHKWFDSPAKSDVSDLKRRVLDLECAPPPPDRGGEAFVKGALVVLGAVIIGNLVRAALQAGAEDVAK
jgi:hypothetical protein